MNLYALQARADPGVRSFRRLLSQISISEVGRQSGKDVSCVLRFFHAELALLLMHFIQELKNGWTPLRLRNSIKRLGC